MVRCSDVCFGCYICLIGFVRVIGFSELVEKVESHFERPKAKKYSSRKLLHRRMLALNPLFADFVTGSECGSAKVFYCRICRRDVKMGSKGSAEFARHFESKKHWEQDVTYRVHMGLPVYNKLMEPMELSARQKDDFLARPFVDLGGEFPFPEDMLPKHSKASSKVPLMTLVSSLSDVLRSGGDFTLVRRLWGYFLASLGGRDPEFSLQWSRSETVVSIFVCLVHLVGGVLSCGFCSFYCKPLGDRKNILLCGFALRCCLFLFLLLVIWVFVSVRVVSRPCSPSAARDVQEHWAISGVFSAVRKGYGGRTLFRSLLGRQLFEEGMCRL